MDTHEELRPYLFAIAYRMLGSVTGAEDVVQEAFVRYLDAGVEPESPKAYLAARRRATTGWSRCTRRSPTTPSTASTATSR